MSTEGFGNLCLYSAALNQLSNSEYTFHPQSGEQFSPLDLKHAMLHFMGINYELLYPVVSKHLEVSYKQWCLDHLQDNTPGDLVAVTSLRYLLNVSTIYICLEFRTAFIPSAISTGIPYGILIFTQCACTAFLRSFYHNNRNVQHLVSHSYTVCLVVRRSVRHAATCGIPYGIPFIHSTDTTYPCTAHQCKEVQ